VSGKRYDYFKVRSNTRHCLKRRSKMNSRQQEKNNLVSAQLTIFAPRYVVGGTPAAADLRPSLCRISAKLVQQFQRRCFPNRQTNSKLPISHYHDTKATHLLSKQKSGRRIRERQFDALHGVTRSLCMFVSVVSGRTEATLHPSPTKLTPLTQRYLHQQFYSTATGICKVI